MMPASVRVSWAARSVDTGAMVALAGAVAAFAFGVVVSFASRNDGLFLAYWCSSVATACLIGVDFPGAGQPRWSEFELSLPIAPLARARARLLLSLAIWLLPTLLALALSQLGAFGAVVRLPAVAALVALWNASASVLFAVAVRHSLSLRLTGPGAVAFRFITIPVVIAGAAVHAPMFGTVLVVGAAPLLALAHRMACRAPELLLPRIDPAPAGPPGNLPEVVPAPARARGAAPGVAGQASAESRTTLGRVALRYSVGTGYGMTMLVLAALWAFGVNGGWLEFAPSHALFLLMWVVSHAMWSTRLLRLGHLPYPRERLFRCVVWPTLAATLIGLGLSLVLSGPDRFAHIETHQGAVSLQGPRGAWRLTTREPPAVTASNGESHRPRPHTVGLGSLITAYDPYEVQPGASRAFVVHQLGRLVLEQRGLSLSPEQLEQRFLPGDDSHRALNGEHYPELRDPSALGGRFVGAATLLLAVLLALHVIVRPGAAPDPNRWRRNPAYLAFLALFMLAQLFQLASVFWKRGADPTVIALTQVGRPLAENALFVLPAAAAIGALLYRSLVRRFAQMEAPPRAKSMDTWFVEI